MHMAISNDIHTRMGVESALWDVDTAEINDSGRVGEDYIETLDEVKQTTWVVVDREDISS